MQRALYAKWSFFLAADGLCPTVPGVLGYADQNVRDGHPGDCDEEALGSAGDRADCRNRRRCTRGR